MSDDTSLSACSSITLRQFRARIVWLRRERKVAAHYLTRSDSTWSLLRYPCRSRLLRLDRATQHSSNSSFAITNKKREYENHNKIILLTSVCSFRQEAFGRSITSCLFSESVAKQSEIYIFLTATYLLRVYINFQCHASLLAAVIILAESSATFAYFAGLFRVTYCKMQSSSLLTRCPSMGGMELQTADLTDVISSCHLLELPAAYVL